MQVRRLAGRPHLVDVEVDRGQAHARARRDPSPRCASRRATAAEVVVAVGVPAGLEPLAELAVVEHDEAAVGGVDDEGAAGEVAGGAGALEGVGVGGEEREHLVADGGDVVEVGLGEQRRARRFTTAGPSTRSGRPAPTTATGARGRPTARRASSCRAGAAGGSPSSTDARRRGRR